MYFFSVDVVGFEFDEIHDGGEWMNEIVFFKHTNVQYTSYNFDKIYMLGKKT